MRYRATLAYDGTAYEGFQRQAEGRLTIQGAVEQALNKITGQAVTVIGAGRTDSGVHATGQVITFDADWQRGDAVLLRAINANLPGDIALQDLSPAPPGFHPRFSARSRLYCYDVAQADQRQPLLRNQAWHLDNKLNGEVMQQAARLLIGEHNFAAFGRPPKGENAVRVVYRSEWTQQPIEYGTLWTYRVEATAFLQHMVRRLVGTLVAVGQGWLTVETFENIFRGANRAAVRWVAPPQGLTLEAVRYDE